MTNNIKSSIKYSVTNDYIGEILKLDLALPKFQRLYVWKGDKALKFIDSLLKNHPTGALTLFEDNELNRHYLLVDGLQRLTSIKLFIESPKKIFDSRNKVLKLYIPHENELISLLNENPLLSNSLLGSLLSKLYCDWFSNMNSLSDGNNFFKFYKTKSAQNFINKTKCSDEKFHEIHRYFNRSVDITHYIFPIITYRGDRSDLSDIFEKINTNTKVLTKYEVYHASWTDRTFQIKEPFQSEYMSYLKKINSEHLLDTEEITEFNVEIYYNFISLNLVIQKIENISIIFKNYKNKDDINFSINDDTGFELYSTLYSSTSNRIDKFVSDLYIKLKDDSSISDFLHEVNVILEDCTKITVDFFVSEKLDISISKYNVYYYIIGLFNIHYYFDNDTFLLRKRNQINSDFLINKLFDYNKHKDEKWFRDEFRQLTFFKEKIEDFLSECNSYENVIIENKQSSYINIDSNYELIFKDIEAYSSSNLKTFLNTNYSFDCKEIDSNKFNINNKLYFCVPLQDVSNEPSNKRVQFSPNLYEDLVNDNFEAVIGVYVLRENGIEQYTLVVWELLNLSDYHEDIVSNINTSLKVKIEDIRKTIFQKQIKHYRTLKYGCTIVPQEEFQSFFTSNIIYNNNILFDSVDELF